MPLENLYIRHSPRKFAYGNQGKNCKESPPPLIVHLQFFTSFSEHLHIWIRTPLLAARNKTSGKKKHTPVIVDNDDYYIRNRTV